MADQSAILTADGQPLKVGLRRALRAQKLRAMLLIAPLLIFIVLTFLAPIADMLFRSVENRIVSETLPRTVVTLERDWETLDTSPPETVYAALAFDFSEAVERRAHTRLATRLNYEATGFASLFRKSGREIDKIGEPQAEFLINVDAAWKDPATWISLLADPSWAQQAYDRAGEDVPAFRLADRVAENLPETASAYESFARTITNVDAANPAEVAPWSSVYLALSRDLAIAESLSGPEAARLEAARDALATADLPSAAEQFAEIDDDWADPELWEVIKTFSSHYTAGYYLNAVDLKLSLGGIETQPAGKRVYLLLFQRTAFMSIVITISCILLGYPIAYLLAHLPLRLSNLLLILVLLPFWTSLLVRTSSWKVLLQQEGVINDILVWIGLVADDARLTMINNQFGTIVAMTHILLPFMILPLFSVMKTIPPSITRAARSLGANSWTAFWRVYFPQSMPGIGAGCILVFILAIGYYITPELVGGRTGTFISNRIAYHISQSLNWSLAAALSTILLALVLALYNLYDRIVGIDKVKLG
ncbi:MAG: ABC transporter permease subunit [Rhodobacteraceae bacterium]|nr:ABC transporter permease subunit [Paracoccaceae bacterium]